MKKILFKMSKKILKKLVFKIICMTLIHKTEEHVDHFVLPLVLRLEEQIVNL